jgi:5-methylcytosine-specific restriction protein A
VHPERPPQESAARRGYGPEWARESAAFLRAHPECVNGCGRRSEVVDHREPHGGDPVKFWDRTNWQAMSRHCHGRKTAKYDGGYGNARKATV